MPTCRSFTIGGGIVALALTAIASPALAEEKCQVVTIAALKVTMHGPRPLVDIKINDHDTRMIVDSGAFFSDLSPGVASEFGLKLEPTSVRMGGIGGSTSTWLTTVKSLVLDGNAVPNVQFIVGGSETGTAGLLGQNVLGLADVEYDLGHGFVRLMKTEGCAHKILTYWAKPDQAINTVDIEARNPPFQTHTIGTAMINGVKIKVIFDTGASSSVVTLAAAKRAGITPDGPGVRETGGGRGVGKKVVRGWIAPVASFKVGDEEIRNTKLRFEDTELGDGDMLLGADFFLSHRVYVANSQHKLYFTYEGGPIFNLTPPKVEDSTGTEMKIAGDDTQPASAAEYGRRGAAEAARREFDKAFADLGKAIELAPADFQYPYQRGMAHLANREPALARADFDLAVKLAPNEADPRLARARLELQERHRDEALADLTDLDKLLARQSDDRYNLAQFYAEIGERSAAIAQYDLWIAAHPEDSHRANALNGRCRQRALEGRELDTAFNDCKAALRLRPDTPTFLDSRGLVELRQGHYDKAIADYDAVLAKQPRNPWALYGRGIAMLHEGKKAESDADLAEAAKSEPNIAERAKKFGIQ